MRYEKEIIRDNGDIVKIITLLTSNFFIPSGYEQEQFALVKKTGSDNWVGYYNVWSPKNMSREEYMTNHRPKTIFGVVSFAELFKAAIDAKKEFFVPA